MEENLSRMRASSTFKNNLSGTYHMNTGSSVVLGGSMSSKKEDDKKVEE